MVSRKSLLHKFNNHDKIGSLLLGFRLIFYSDKFEQNLSAEENVKKYYGNRVFNTYYSLQEKYEGNVSKRYSMEVWTMTVFKGAKFTEVFGTSYTFDEIYSELKEIKEKYNKDIPFVVLTMTPEHPANTSGVDKVLTVFNINTKFEIYEGILENLLEKQNWVDGDFEVIAEYGQGAATWCKTAQDWGIPIPDWVCEGFDISWSKIYIGAAVVGGVILYKEVQKYNTNQRLKKISKK